MSQICMLCDSDDCTGHPPRKVRPRVTIEHVTAGQCPICEHMANKAVRHKHQLGGQYQIKRALTFGPVFCLSKKGVKKGDLPYEAVVHGVRIRDGSLQLDTLAGWAEEFTAIWAICSPEPYKDASL